MSGLIGLKVSTSLSSALKCSNKNVLVIRIDLMKHILVPHESYPLPHYYYLCLGLLRLQQ